MEILTDFRKSVPHNKTSNNMKPIERFHAMVPSYLSTTIAKAFDLVNTIWNPFSVTSAKNQLVPFSSTFEDNFVTSEEDFLNDRFCQQFFSSIQHRKFDFSAVKTKGFENLVNSCTSPTPGNAVGPIQLLTKVMLSSINALDSVILEPAKHCSPSSKCSKPNTSLLDSTIQDTQPVIQQKLLIVPSIRQLRISVNLYKMEKTAKKNTSCHNQLLMVNPKSTIVNKHPVICATTDSTTLIVDQVVQPAPNHLKDSVNIDKVNCSRESLNQEMTHRKNKKICKLSKKKRRREKRKTKKQIQNINAKSKSALPKQVVKNSTNDEVDHFDVIFDSSSPKAQSSCDLFMGVTSRNYENGACDINPTISFVLGCTTDLESEDDSECSYDGNTDSVIEDLTFQFDGFFTNGLSSVSVIGSRPIVSDLTISVIDLSELSGELKDINTQWEKNTFDVPSKPKSPTKVSFASDPDLVSIFPVDIYNRKGEWEIYATERMRFKRRIEDMEKILSPCLSQAHREKVHLQSVINDTRVIK